MSKLEFKIYIGKEMLSNQGVNVIAIVEPITYIPHGQCNVAGQEIESNLPCFTRLYDLGTYVADWLDIFGEDNAVKATIYLNISSLHRTFVGRDIVNIIDKINRTSNFDKIRSFKDLI